MVPSLKGLDFGKAVYPALTCGANKFRPLRDYPTSARYGPDPYSILKLRGANLLCYALRMFRGIPQTGMTKARDNRSCQRVAKRRHSLAPHVGAGMCKGKETESSKGRHNTATTVISPSSS